MTTSKRHRMRVICFFFFIYTDYQCMARTFTYNYQIVFCWCLDRDRIHSLVRYLIFEADKSNQSIDYVGKYVQIDLLGLWIIS